MQKKINQLGRRDFIKGVTAGASTLAVGIGVTGCATVDFLHGVASGDPLQDAVIIWTRITINTQETIPVSWVVASDEKCHRIVTKGVTTAGAESDYTVKVDVTGLEAGKRYYYRFSVLGSDSPIGKTRTLPSGFVTHFTLGVFSCSNYPAGFFNAYKQASKQKLDAVVHLGDYIYEYGEGEYATENAQKLGRLPIPRSETIDLDHYRARYSQYRTDKDLQQLHRKFPFICVWDDHEIANDTWRNGAENHNDEEGDFSQRRYDAIKAYYEWMPIREISPDERERIYRNFQVGELVNLMMLDTRLIGRDLQLKITDYFTDNGSFDAAAFQSDLNDPNRTLLGPEQRQWLQSELNSSSATWQVLGQQVLMGRMQLPLPIVTQQIGLEDYAALVRLAESDPCSLTPEQRQILQLPSIPYNLDAWDGYSAEREVVLETVNQLDKNLVVLAGDTHNGWANELKTIEGNAVGVEFATPSVTSPGLETILTDADPDAVAAGIVQLIPDLKYVNAQHRGFLTLEFTPEKVTSTWTYVNTILSRKYKVLDSSAKRLSVVKGDPVLVSP